MYCINLKKRKGMPFCKLQNMQIALSDCYNCIDKKYKQIEGSANCKKCKLQSTMKQQTSKHRKLDNNRFSVFTDDLDHCIICGRKKDNLHEILYGSYRSLSIKYGLVIPLCVEHHVLSNESIHLNKELDIYWKKKAQDKFIELYDYDLFIKEFTIDYKEKYK